MQLGQLVKGLDIRLVTPAPLDLRICDITEDSRTALPGSLFVARSGAKADGRQFALDAARAGAVAILTDNPEPLKTGHACPNVAIAVTPDVMLATAQLAERFYGNPSAALDTVGVTGTNGKTTTTWLIWQIMNAVGHRCGLIGTVMIDDGTEVARAAMTTPPSIEMSRSLALMVEAGCRAVALESSSHALHQHRVAALEIDIGVFTNLTQDHLDYHATMAEYAQVKTRLFEMLPASGCAIVNADDPAAASMVQATKARAVRTRMASAVPASEGELSVRVLTAAMSGMRLSINSPQLALEFDTPLIGRYNAMNVAQAVAACHALGLTPAEISLGLAGISAPPGRLERVSAAGDDIHVFVDFAHTDDGLTSVLGAVRAVMTAGRLCVVFGCGGDKDRTKRPRMGLAAASLADTAVVTSDNPRTERPGDIIDQVLAGITASLRSKVTVQADRHQAIGFAIAGAQPGDVVVIAGKGHETEQILPDAKGGTTTIHFDDREVAHAALVARRRSHAVRVVIPSHPPHTKAPHS
ncbi:MAG: UDP-N-acetylmuramoyl-L-alanyl-D-glutamate--2,6-diaminopimelate ligase [Planctomycetota bacterium]